MQSPRRSSVRSFLVLPSAAVVTLVMPLVFAAAPRDGHAVAVITFSAQDGGAAAIAARANGILHSASPGNRIVIASAEAPGFVSRLYAAGAGLVIDAALATACLSPLVSLTVVPTP